ncbi:cyclic peptide export ABC transporter [Paraburkholderia sp. D15]|uniref:cyclic peptide export ABC transporter n=1 Tax=Paraburkholderia sp. D15 TaxID=2880218 RepID=UPI002479F103|nr:cyclic peptide export ABC transporter [Paraburkholderia sp. D15]WGS52779.1 cyclic peptide export ABC transporter [Paraburkholderia sp. D15]
MPLILFLLRSARWLVLVALSASLVSGLANAALVALINKALGAAPSQLATLGLQFAGVGAVVLIARLLSQTLFMYLGQRAKATLRMRTIARIAQASYAHLEKHGAARSLAVLTQDLDAIVVFFISLPAIAMQGAVIAGCLVYLGMLSWQILLVALATVGIGTLGFYYANDRALFHLRASRQREDALVERFRALFDGAKELKLHRARRHAFVSDALAPHVEAVRVQRTRGYVLYAAAASWGSLILFAFVGLTLFVLTRVYTVETHVMSGYALVFLYMIMPIENLLAALPSLGSARVALERIEKLNTELPLELSSTAPPSPAFQSIRFEQVTHRYFREKENGFFTLGPVDLRFVPGELVFVIGGNGSGKTTLAKLLVGLYEPENGRVLLDEHPVDEMNRESYRQLFSVVFSDFFLFDTLFGLPVNSEATARALLVDLQLDHKVRIENGTFTTLDLSQGQRKRLALLVAFLEDRPFYLFDEWAADQDPVFKDVFYHRLLPALKAQGKTVVAITHDDRYFHLADRCVKLEHGRLAGDVANHGASPALSGTTAVAP